MSEGARVTELMTAPNWLRLVRVGSETEFAPRFPVELAVRGDEEQFDLFLTRVSFLCDFDRSGLEQYAPAAGVDVYDEEQFYLELAIWTGQIFGPANPPETSTGLARATRLAFLEMLRQFVDTLVSWGLRPRGSAEEAATAISELCGLLCELANLQIPLQEVTGAWIASLQAQGKLRPDSDTDAEELTWTRAVARELVAFAYRGHLTQGEDKQVDPWMEFERRLLGLLSGDLPQELETGCLAQEVRFWALNEERGAWRCLDEGIITEEEAARNLADRVWQWLEVKAGVPCTPATHREILRIVRRETSERAFYD